MKKTSTLFPRLAAVVLAATLGGCERSPESPADAWRRAAGGLALNEVNVVLVTIDTLRADRLGCYGDAETATPNLDRLAREGVRFARAASTVPFTLPAHSSIMTGSYPPRHGIRENVGYALDAGIPTLAERLRAAGRETAGFVSAFVLDRRYGLARGFEVYDDRMQGAQAQVVSLEAERRGDHTAEALDRWLEQYAAAPPSASGAGGAAGPRAPFFAWLHLYDPHEPYHAPQPFGGAFLTEVGRGCGRACRFCAAGWVYLPVRRKRIADVLGARPEISRWSFSTNGVATMGRHRIPTVGFAPGLEELSHTTGEWVAVDDLVKAAAVYSLIPESVLRHKDAF